MISHTMPQSSPCRGEKGHHWITGMCGFLSSQEMDVPRGNPTNFGRFLSMGIYIYGSRSKTHARLLVSE